jgi:hypothetical protein
MTGVTIITTTQESRHDGNNVVMTVMVIQVYLFLCFSSVINNTINVFRALVTAKARVEKHAKWNSIRQGKKIQEQLAIELHTHLMRSVGCMNSVILLIIDWNNSRIVFNIFGNSCTSNSLNDT